ncbi:MAG: CDP-alcohol phosphatidyltransferase family protein [Floccifex porci]|uniref:CDP-alcohol phosphatidyltransferase family protein n=1 Tax=Floccifex porci TaxID=2606629 RepID=UPI0023F227A7|nr:CDP-alcohol phosphatidyltransferase family protein [Floccifex porci]MDD7467648.1 CDP-alcohol phosphatidyltransferase family protein [Floccifex porci]
MRSIKLKHPANWITSIRLVSSFCLFFCNPFSFSFYFFYLLAGFSDIFDGYIARKTKTESEWGSKFDTFSDFIFIMVTLYKCIPYFHFDKWIVCFIGFIFLIRIGNGIFSKIYGKTWIVKHTMLNKITGLFLYLLPFLYSYSLYVIIVCTIAFISSIEEGYLIYREIKRQ